MVEYGDLIVQQSPIGLVEINPFFDHRLIVLVQWNAAEIDSARVFESAGLEFERVVAAMAVFVDPFAD